jgi:hypothetical protein
MLLSSSVLWMYFFLGCVPVERRQRRQSIKRLYLLIKTPPSVTMSYSPGSDDLNIKRNRRIFADNEGQKKIITY